jgi:hypothetical protein
MQWELNPSEAADVEFDAKVDEAFELAGKVAGFGRKPFRQSAL